MGALIKTIFWKGGSDQFQNCEEDDPSTFFSFKMKDLQGNLIDFSPLANKKAILVVNVASKCRLTFSNYKALTQMHNELSHLGFQVLAFPCNQFKKQENGSHEAIVKFVKHKFGTQFQLMQKVDVNGPKTHPVYKYLRTKSELYNKETKKADLIPWNFSKFLLNQKGEIVRYFNPFDDLEEVRVEVEALL